MENDSLCRDSESCEACFSLYKQLSKLDSREEMTRLPSVWRRDSGLNAESGGWKEWVSGGGVCWGLEGWRILDGSVEIVEHISVSGAVASEQNLIIGQKRP